MNFKPPHSVDHIGIALGCLPSVLERLRFEDRQAARAIQEAASRKNAPVAHQPLQKLYVFVSIRFAFSSVKHRLNCSEEFHMSLLMKRLVEPPEHGRALDRTSTGALPGLRGVPIHALPGRIFHNGPAVPFVNQQKH